MAFGNSIVRSGADALMPEQYLPEIFQGVDQQSVCLDVMSRQPNMSRLQERIMVLDVLPEAFFTEGDDGLRKTTFMKWRNKFFNAAEISVIAPISQNVLDDAGYPIWDQAMPKIKQAIAKAIDNKILVSQTPPQYWPSCIKNQALAAGQTLSLSTGNVGNTAFANPYQALAGANGLYSKLENVGYDPTGGIGSMPFKGSLRGMVDSNNRPLLLGVDTPVSQAPNYSVAGVPFRFAKNAAFTSDDALAIVGDFAEAIYTYRQDIAWRVVKDGVITDANQQIIFNLTQQRMVALMLWCRFAWQVPNPPTILAPGSGNPLNDVDDDDNNTTRSPFALLVA